MKDPAHIALIDRDASVLDALCLMLESPERRVSGYGDADSFLDALRNGQTCDLLLMDPHLPGTDGLELLQVLADRMPVALLTARPHSAAVDAMRHHGVAAVMVKPVAAEALMAFVAGVLRRSS